MQHTIIAERVVKDDWFRAVVALFCYGKGQEFDDYLVKIDVMGKELKSKVDLINRICDEAQQIGDIQAFITKLHAIRAEFQGQLDGIPIKE